MRLNCTKFIFDTFIPTALDVCDV